MDKDRLKKTISTHTEKINEQLYKMFVSGSSLTRQVFNQTIRTGKRLRPLLVVYSTLCSNYEGDMTPVYRLGAIVELVHTASLLHDDVIDEADVRREVVSSNRLFGNKASILAGDYMYSLAYNVVLDYDKKIAKKISEAAYTLSEGETKEIENTGNMELTEKKYLEIIYMKTGILIEASSVVGAIFSGCDKDRIDLFSEMGKNLGIAFQIYDDVLDYMGTEEKMGKETMKDIREGKATLPLIHSLHNDDGDLMDAVRKLEKSDVKRESLLKIKRLVEERSGIVYSLKKAEDYAERAKKAISFIEISSSREVLEALIDYSVNREH
jgi:octaprenyl-diphosphate synthase